MIVGNGFIDKKFGKNTLVGVVLVFMFLLMLSFSFAKENSQSDIVNLTNTKDGTGNIVSVYFFWGEGCPHCIDQKPFMDELKAKYGEKINIHSYYRMFCLKFVLNFIQFSMIIHAFPLKFTIYFP